LVCLHLLRDTVLADNALVPYVPVIPLQEDDFVDCYYDDAVSRLQRVGGAYQRGSTQFGSSLQASTCEVLGIRRPLSGDPDDLVWSYATATLIDCADTVSKVFRELMSKACPSSTVPGSVRVSANDKQLFKTKGCITGVSREIIPGLLTEKVSKTSVTDFVACEAQLVRCLVQCPNSKQRLAILALWCVVACRFGLERQVQCILYKAHVIGLAMRDVSCEPLYNISSYYQEHRRFAKALDHAWDSAMRSVFRARDELYDFARDMNLCLLHPPFLCPSSMRLGNGQSVDEAIEAITCLDDDPSMNSYVESANRKQNVLNAAVASFQGNRFMKRQFLHDNDHGHINPAEGCYDYCYCVIEGEPCKFGSECGSSPK
jgi:hypothetical protein